jgi:hypothetical protein
VPMGYGKVVPRSEYNGTGSGWGLNSSTDGRALANKIPNDAEENLAIWVSWMFHRFFWHDADS